MNSVSALVIEAGFGIKWMFGLVADAILDPFDVTMIAGIKKLFLLAFVVG
jgi:hypothetical protein